MSARTAAQARQPRAVLYLRQSIAREESISLELQEAAGREYCRQQGYAVVAVEADPGISGRTWKRPAVLRAMTAIETGAADVIVLWKWSRLSRARLDWAIALDKVESHGGRIESATEPMDTSTSAGRLARGMLAEFAAFESERIGEGWKETIHSRQRRGLPGTGGKRFGYVQVAKDQYEPDPETGEVLAEVYQRAVRGHSMMSIAEWLNAEGIPTTTGGVWSRSRVRPILDSGFGAGFIAAGRGVERRFIPAAHDAVVDVETWTEYVTQRELAPHRPAQNAARYPLTGLLVCGDCGSGMSMTTRTSGGKTQQVYGCNRYQKYRTGRYVTTVRQRVEEWVKGEVATMVSDLEGTVASRAKQRARKIASVNDAAVIVRKIESIDARIAKAMDGWASGVLTDDEYRAGVARYREEREGLLARRAVLHRDGETDDRLGSVAASLVTRWDDLEITELRAMLAVLIERITVVPPVQGKPSRSGATYRLEWRYQ